MTLVRSNAKSGTSTLARASASRVAALVLFAVLALAAGAAWSQDVSIRTKRTGDTFEIEARAIDLQGNELGSSTSRLLVLAP